jgi:hypothetical protein
MNNDCSCGGTKSDKFGTGPPGRGFYLLCLHAPSIEGWPAPRRTVELVVLLAIHSLH